jgi:TPR repeat protein
MADLNCPQMQEALGEIRNKNFESAIALLVPLADAGNPKAQCHLATLYQCGLGVNTDGKKAVSLYSRVARQRIRKEHLSAIAYNNLATIYAVGIRGVRPDRAKAKIYQKLARSLGFEM